MADQEAPKSRIRELREAKGLTRQVVASYVKVTLNAIYDWEVKPEKAAELVQLYLLCAALSCQPEGLIAIPALGLLKSLEQIHQGICSPSSNQDNSSSKPKISQLRELRGLRKLTQEGLAEAIGMEVKTLQNWESERTSPKKFIHLVKLCEVLECNHRDLFSHVPESKINDFCCVLGNQYIDLFDADQCSNINTLHSIIVEQNLDSIRSSIRDNHPKPRALDKKKGGFTSRSDYV